MSQDAPRRFFLDIEYNDLENVYLTKIPGYANRKPIEVEVFPLDGGYVASHTLPSDLHDKGTPIYASGLTVSDAVDELAKSLAERFENPASDLESSYLNSIMNRVSH